MRFQRVSVGYVLIVCTRGVQGVILQGEGGEKEI